MEDIETILNTLIYDGKVEMTIIAAKEGTVGSVDGQLKLFRGVNPIIQPAGLVRTPCGLCPVRWLFFFQIKFLLRKRHVSPDIKNISVNRLMI